jgi:hypothetical protein
MNKVMMMFETKWGGVSSHRALAAALVCIALAGCVGGAQMVKPDYRFNEGERKGLGVLSVEVNDRCGKNTPVVHYRAAESATDTLREIELDKDSKGKVSGFPQGWFFIQEEDAGDFVFTHVSYGKEVRTAISRSPVTFSNGRVAYLGALQVSIPDCERISVTVADRSDRDFPLFETYMKNFKSKYVIKQVIGGS